MSGRATDRNLLFGTLAVQLGFVTCDQATAAMRACVSGNRGSLADVLSARGDLSADRRALLEVLVGESLARHGGDAGEGLSAVGSRRDVLDELRRIADPDFAAAQTVLDPDSRIAAESPAVRPGGRPAAGATRFRILRPHAKGGLGQVSVALDEELRREVALKEIRRRHADDAASRDRFLLEAEVTGGLEHPGIVPVYALGTYTDGRPYYAMRFVKGDSLKTALEQFHRSDDAPFPPGSRAEAPSSTAFASLAFRNLLGRFVDVCNAIAYAHSRGVLHRDLKPENVMLGRYGETLVVDWGLAEVFGERSGGGFDVPGRRTVGAAGPLGSPAYMSPEQAAGGTSELGPATDVYGLGATLYALLTGRPPISASNLEEALRRAKTGDLPPPRRVAPAVPKPLAAVCEKAMSRDPADRYASPDGLAADLEAWLADEPVGAYREPLRTAARRWLRRRPRFTAFVAAGLLLGFVSAAAIAGLVTQKNRELQRLGALRIVDPGVVHARAIPLRGLTFTEHTYAWRIYIPRGGRYRFNVAIADVRRANFPTIEDGRNGFSHLLRPEQTGREIVERVAIGIDPHGVPQVKLAETGRARASYVDRGGHLEWLRGGTPQPDRRVTGRQLSARRRAYGVGGTIRLPPDQDRLPLVRVTRTDRGRDGRFGTADDFPTGEGLLVWIERVRGDPSPPRAGAAVVPGGPSLRMPARTVVSAPASPARPHRAGRGVSEFP